MSDDARIEERAERLEVSMLIFGLVREPPRDAMRATWLLSPELREAFEDAADDEDEEDIALANACLAAEAERRRRGWEALERLLAVAARNPGVRMPVAVEVAEAVAGGGSGGGGPALSPEDRQDMLLALYDLNWIRWDTVSV